MSIKGLKWHMLEQHAYECDEYDEHVFQLSRGLKPVNVIDLHEKLHREHDIFGIPHNHDIEWEII